MKRNEDHLDKNTQPWDMVHLCKQKIVIFEKNIQRNFILAMYLYSLVSVYRGEIIRLIAVKPLFPD